MTMTSTYRAFEMAKERRAARTRSLKPAADPNVIPFIDILMVLLVIFMVTAPMPTVDIKVDLPQNAHSQPPIGLKATIVVLRETAGGLEYSVDDEIVSAAALGQKVQAHAWANNPSLDVNDLFAEARIFVRADQSTAYSNVVHTIDAVKAAGFVKVGIFAESANEE
ncbi:MAG: biopolymer transporter ExbD [Alphaproteobacteria bacterium]